MKRIFIFALTVYSSMSLAALPEYSDPEILARANITDGYNLPAMSFLSNTCPVINNKGEVAFKIISFEGVNSQALWMRKENEFNGKIIYTAPDERFITDPSLSDNSKIAFNLFDEGVTDGLFLLDGKTDEVDQVLKPDRYPIQFYTYPNVLNNDHIYFRATDDNNDRTFYEWNGTKLVKLIAEGTETQGVKSSYLFRPAVNEAGAVAFKSRMGKKGEWDESNPDSILMIVPGDKTSPSKIVTIAKDKDTDPMSHFLSFGNSVTLSKKGYISFIGVQLDKKKSIVLFKDNALKIIASEGENGLSEIELFTPKVNDQGMVLFRAKDQNGMRGIYLADESSMKKVIGEGDVVKTDKGDGKILSNPNYPAFGGEVDMNDQGEIVFYGLIVSEADNKELGSAVYKISPKR